MISVTFSPDSGLSLATIEVFRVPPGYMWLVLGHCRFVHAPRYTDWAKRVPARRLAAMYFGVRA